MRVLFVVPLATPLFDTLSPVGLGGAEIRAWALATLLAEHPAFSVTFMFEGGNALSEQKLDGVFLKQLTRRRPEKKEPVIEFEGCRFSAQHLRPYFNSNTDLLVAFGACQRSAEVIAAGKLSGIKTLLFLASDADLDPEYTSDSSARNLWGTPNKLCSLAVRHADFVVGQSMHQAAMAKIYFDRDIARLASPIPRYMPQGSNLERDPFILWVGKSNDIKRPEIFLDLAIKFSELPFVMVMNRDRQGLWEWINFQAPKNLEIIERLPPVQMQPLYQQALLLVNTSRVEGFPTSFLQAGMHKLPILSLEADPDGLLTDHGGGVCVDGNIEQIEEALGSLWINREAVSKLGENLYSYVTQLHDDKDIAQRLRDLILRTFAETGKLNHSEQRGGPKALTVGPSPRKSEYSPARISIFVNFHPDASVPYGGGNIAVANILDFLNYDIAGVEITYHLREDIDLYLVIDPHSGRHKSASLDEIISYRHRTNPNVPILVRINDCDVTRPDLPAHLSKEAKILEHWSKITWFIFNSEFIHQYYRELRGAHIPNGEVIHNGCDGNVFYPRETSACQRVTKIVTHHWSSNPNKGYSTYIALWRYCQRKDDLEFTFIGKNVPDFFSEVPITGPFIGVGLGAALRDQSIYITDARSEACPNHVIEAIMSGLPVLFHDGPGGARELCTMGDILLGEPFECFEDIPEKIKKIRANYESYRAGAISLRSAFEKKRAGQAYYERIELLTNCSQIDRSQTNVVLQILLCADAQYFVGLFACLYSALSNTQKPQALHFNFLIPQEDGPHFEQLLEDFRRRTGFVVPSTIVYVSDAIVDPVIRQSRCIDGGGHLSNLANYSRLLAGGIFQYDKLLYLDSDSVVNCDLVEKLAEVVLAGPLAAIPANRKGRELFLASIIDTDHDWFSVLGNQPSPKDCAFMGAPLLINCTQWVDVEPLLKRIVHAHNRSKTGLYKLFTMSLQNLIFYGQTADLSVYLNCMADCGSAKKVWPETELHLADILDWSGNLKPWYVNGLHRSRWLRYDVLGLSENMGWVSNERDSVEEFESISHQGLSAYIEFKSPETNFAANSYLYRLMETGRECSGAALKLLYVIDAVHLICKMSRVRFWAIEALAARSDIHLQFCGPGLPEWDAAAALQDNIAGFNTEFDFVLLYKPLAPNIAFNVARGLPYPAAVFYNEMWDESITRSEIEQSGANLVVCHHGNDHHYYSQLYARNASRKIVHIPHIANPNIFYDTNTVRDIDILLVGRSTGGHYPLRERIRKLTAQDSSGRLDQYRIHVLEHPGYEHEDAFTNRFQKEFATLLRRTKLVVTCASRHKYRLGKYVEIPMSGAVICGDIPDDENTFDRFIAVVDLSMTDDQILDVIDNHLTNTSLWEEKAVLGKKWAEKFSPDWYASQVVHELRQAIDQYARQKVYVVADEIPAGHAEFNGEKWICDTLKNEFSENFPKNVTLNAMEADVIWYLAPWNMRHVPAGFTAESWRENLLTKDVVMTLHHIDETKLTEGAYDSILAFMSHYGSRYHAICRSTYEFLRRTDSNKPIQQLTLWINTQRFFPLRERMLELRQQWGLPSASYLVGSFQKDTEGKAHWNCPVCGYRNSGSDTHCKDTSCGLNRHSNIPLEYAPKLSKGPDIFIDVVIDMRQRYPNLEVVLTGLRRQWLCTELTKAGIPFHYFEMVGLDQVNQLYACLDLYLVASRVEGGPRALFESGATFTPIISTDVGVASELLPKESIWNAKKPLSYKDAKPNVQAVAKTVSKLCLKEHIDSHGTHILGRGRRRIIDKDDLDETKSDYIEARVVAPADHFIVIEANLLDVNARVDIPEDKIVVLARRGIRIYDAVSLTAECDAGSDSVVAYSIDNPNDKELALVIHSDSAAYHTVGSLIERALVHTDLTIGCNTSSLLYGEVLEHYWLMGLFNLCSFVQPFAKLRDQYRSFVDSEVAGKNRYNQEILRRLYAFEKGLAGEQLDEDALENFLVRNSEHFIQRKCLVASKFLQGYGGNQRVALQIIGLLAREFDVYIWSVSQVAGKNWDFERDRLHPDVHNRSIIKLKSPTELIEHIDGSEYQLIVNNKSHEFFEIHKSIARVPSVVISHNASDPFNRLVIDNQWLFDLVMTVGRAHEKLLRENGLIVPSGLFINAAKDPTELLVRSALRRRLIFVGRLSDEKGLPLLLAGFELARSRLPDLNLELEVIGDGAPELTIRREGVHFLGRLSHSEIQSRLLESDYLVLPSSTEGMPFAILDAMSAGIPCIGSDITGVNEIISDQVNGFLFELEGYSQHREIIDQWLTADSVRAHFNNNVEHLAACIIKACDRSLGEWQQLSIAAQNTIAHTYSERTAKTLNLSRLEPFLRNTPRQKLIICTTAIPRGSLHEASLGAMYKKYRKELDKFEVHHIIHLDEPHALRSSFDADETEKLLRQLIPPNVHTKIIRSSTPSFLDAYKRLVTAVRDLEILDDNAWVWWFEDDWAPTQSPAKFLSLMSVFRASEKYALGLASDAHLGSFRGGPLMTAAYFEAFFDIESKGVLNDSCDPEKQVRRWLSGKAVKNGDQRIHRQFDVTASDKKINILQISEDIDSLSSNALESATSYYRRTTSFNDSIEFTISHHSEAEIRLLPPQLEASALTYVMIYPPPFCDIGRSFNTEHGLTKWTSPEHKATYQIKKADMRIPIAIATTAINRSELHNDTLASWITWLEHFDPTQFAVKWFINIDVITSLDDDFKETRQSLERIIDGRFEVEFVSDGSKSANFLTACQRLGESIDAYLQSWSADVNSFVVWLEDDWRFNAEGSIDPKTLIDRYGVPRSAISLSYIRQNYIWNLAPSIIAFKLFKELHLAAWRQQNKFADPEHTVGQYYRREFGDPSEMSHLTVINQAVTVGFFDQPHMSRGYAKYIAHNDCLDSNWPSQRHVALADIKATLGEQIAFIRITPSMCDGGGKVGREFMEKNGLKKAKTVSDPSLFYDSI